MEDKEIGSEMTNYDICYEVIRGLTTYTQKLRLNKFLKYVSAYNSVREESVQHLLDLRQQYDPFTITND